MSHGLNKNTPETYFTVSSANNTNCQGGLTAEIPTRSSNEMGQRVGTLLAMTFAVLMASRHGHGVIGI